MRPSHHLFTGFVCGALLIAHFGPAPAVAADVIASGNALIILIRDPGIQRELRLSPSQRRALEELLDQWNERLFGLRMLSAETDADKIADTVSAFERALAEVLDAKQRLRLEGLRAQAVGWASLLRPEIGELLKLTPDQRQKTAAILEQTQSSRQVLQSAESADQDRELLKLKAAERDQVAALLTDEQKRTWLQLVGPRYDFSRVRQVAARAPELREVTEWINGEPLTLEGLRGRVVVLHFFAADCINCIRNFPHYKKWDEQFPDEQVSIVGIHTPETKREREVSHVRTKLQEHGLEFPVAIDNDEQNWNAWTNRIWPSVYLIDKQGHVRYWWYGELQWKGNDGEALMRQRIEELLAERG